MSEKSPSRYQVHTKLHKGKPPRVEIQDFLTQQTLSVEPDTALWLAGQMALAVHALMEASRQQMRAQQKAGSIVVPGKGTS